MIIKVYKFSRLLSSEQPPSWFNFFSMWGLVTRCQVKSAFSLVHPQGLLGLQPWEGLRLYRTLSKSLESCCISAIIWNHVLRSVVHSAIQDHARSKHKLTGGGSNDWPTLTPPPGFGPSVKAYFLVHFRSLHLSTKPFVLVSNLPFVFHSTPQARSQQETENLLKKLPPVNDISGVLYLVDPMWIFSPRMWEELQF